MNFYRTEMLRDALAEHSKVYSTHFIGDDEMHMVKD